MLNTQSSYEIFDEELLDLYNQQFNYDSFKKLIKNKTNQSNEIINRVVTSFDTENKEDIKYVVKLSDEQKEQLEDGIIKFDQDKEGNLFAQLRENGKYGKKLNITEEVNQTDLTIAMQLEAIKDVLKEMVEMLEDIEEGVQEILVDLHNDRLGLYYSGIALYLEALQVKDDVLKKQLVGQSLKSLNDAQAQIMQEFKKELLYLKSNEYKNLKKKKQEKLKEKMSNINECYQTINRIVCIKAMIYFDNKEISATLMTFTEYQKFIEMLVKPNSAYLTECDSRNDKLINGIWSKRASVLYQCKEIQKELFNNKPLYIELEG